MDSAVTPVTVFVQPDDISDSTPHEEVIFSVCDARAAPSVEPRRSLIPIDSGAISAFTSIHEPNSKGVYIVPIRMV